jgi:NAD(P)H-flavin reductase
MYTALVITSLPYFRRNFFEVFYWLHLNFFFMGNIASILHNRTNVVWIVSGVVLWYIDVFLRAFCKMAKVELKEIVYIPGDESSDKPMCKIVLNQSGYPRAPNKHHPGSYIWLSIGGKVDSSGMKSDALEMVPLSPQVVPAEEPGNSVNAAQKMVPIMPNVQSAAFPPGGVPSFIWFHPITITSFDPDTKDITLYIKSFGDNEWSGNLCRIAKLVGEGQLKLSDIKCHVGGPHGSLQVDPYSVDKVILVSGGIGITPMAAILEDLIRSKAQKSTAPEVLFVWNTRSLSEIKTFSYLFDACKNHDIDLRIHYTGKSPKISLDELGLGYASAINVGRYDIAATIIVQGSKTGVFVCGPEVLSIAVEGFVNDKQKEGFEIFLHRETFEI